MNTPLGVRLARLSALTLVIIATLLLARDVYAQDADDEGAASPPDQVTLYFYWGIGCEHCADERPFLAGWQSQYPNLVVDEYEVWQNDENYEKLKQHAEEINCNASSTPVTIIGERCWVGFDQIIAGSIEESLAATMTGVSESGKAEIEVPLLGVIDILESPLWMSAVIIGFIDGVNPCSLWVLSVLLAIVLHSGSRGRVIVVGTTFLAVTAGMYALYMVGAYSALSYLNEMKWIRFGVALIALVFGLIHIKDYFWFKEGVSLSIDDSQKPGLYKRMRSVADMDKSLPAALGGTVLLAVGVSLLETPCTAGLPLLWANLLASQGVDLTTAIALFGVYMFVFLLDELLVFFAAVVTLRAAKVQEQHGRLLKLVSGVFMVTLALAMVFRYESLSTVSGTLWVFGLALGIVALVWAASWLANVFRNR